MIKGRQTKHSLISIFMLAAGLVLVARLFMLTVVENRKWTELTEDMSVRAVYETAPRGDILDRNGKVIAGSRPRYSVVINRAYIDRSQAMESAAHVMETLESMGEDITVTMDEVRRSLSDAGYDSYMPITVAENVSAGAAEKIKKENCTGVSILTDFIREYPYKNTAAHIIGYLGRISEEDRKTYTAVKGYRQDSLIGIDGIERICERELKGTDSVSSVRVDSQGDVTDFIGKSPMKKGKSIKLSIDIRLQQVMEDALEQAIKKAATGESFASKYGDYTMSYAPNTASGAAVALDVKTGQVLAMASFPDFDPNDFAMGISREKWASLQQKNLYDSMSPAPLYNTATMTAVQPGSTFKPVTALAAMHCGLDEKRYLYDAGSVDIGGRSFGCSLWNDTGSTHGYVDLRKAMAVSCNYYFYDIAAGRDLASNTGLGYKRPINNEVIMDFAGRLGLGEKTGIEINESTGIRPSEELKREGIKSSLRNYLLAESERYFKRSSLKNRKKTIKNIEKIVNLSDKDLSLEEIIGKLNNESFIRKDRIYDLASVCKYTYFAQAKWSRGDTFNIAIGQGDNAYTTLQMANYMATLANRGIKRDVTLLLGKAENKDAEKGVTLNRDDVRYIIDSMTDVTRKAEGSLYRAFSRFPYSVAAKTGTAQKAGKKNTEKEEEYLRRHLHLIAPDITMAQVEREAERLREEYPDVYDTDGAALRRAVINKSSRNITSEDIDHYKESYDSFAWTVAIAPAEDPQIAVAVMLVEGRTSSNAAPVAREIIGKYGEISRWEKSF